MSPPSAFPSSSRPRSRGACIGNIFEAANGDTIYRHASFLAGKLGEQIAGENITVIDDGTMVGGFGTSPFDGEGLPTRRKVVIENGVLKNYLLNTYTARKLGLRPPATPRADSPELPASAGGNFYLEPGEPDAGRDHRRHQGRPLRHRILGFGVNLVTGDFSRGATGLWIENGELTYAVEEITVAGNLKDMFSNIAAIGNDLEFRGAITAPTLRIEGMTIAGA